MKKTTKSKKSRTVSHLVYNKYFTFYKYDTSKFIKLSLDSKINSLKELRDKLELFYYETVEIKPNKEDKIKDLEKKKSCA